MLQSANLYLSATSGRMEKKEKGERQKSFSHSVPLTVLFSNQFLEDLDKIWELRHWIPDPTKPILPPNKVQRTTV